MEGFDVARYARHASLVDKGVCVSVPRTMRTARGTTKAEVWTGEIAICAAQLPWQPDRVGMGTWGDGARSRLKSKKKTRVQKSITANCGGGNPPRRPWATPWMPYITDIDVSNRPKQSSGNRSGLATPQDMRVVRR